PAARPAGRPADRLDGRHRDRVPGRCGRGARGRGGRRPSRGPCTAAGGGRQGRPNPGALSAAARDGREASAAIATIGCVTSRVYALANQKGGVGKTTTAINMAACVAEAGTPVLLIDLDPQANATTGLGYRPEDLEASSYDLLHGRPLDEVLVETDVHNLWLVPSHPDLAAAQVEL